MVFSSFEFLCIFLPVLCIVYAILPSIRWKNGLLIIGSLLFYAYGEPVYVLLMIGSSLVHYLLAMGISKSASAKKPLLALDVILSLVVLGLFKYTGMIVTTINQIAHSNIPVPAIVMPIGISFFTFQSMSYVIDVYRERVEVQTNFFKVLLYISFFPQLIAGPIVKYRDISKEIDERHTDLNKEHELYETVPVLRTKTEIGDLNKMIYPMWSQPEWNYDYQYKKNYTYTSDTKSVEDAYITTTNKKAQGSLLMFRDSFGNTLLPWMAQSYEKAVFSKEMPYPLEKYMQESKADTVIIEKVERNLKDFITDPPMLTPSETKLSGEAKQVETKTTVHVGVSEADTAYTEVSGKLDSKYVTPGMKVYVAVGEDSDQHIYQAYLVNDDSSDNSLDTTTTQYRLYLPQETVDTKTKVQVYVESEQGLYLVGQSLKGE